METSASHRNLPTDFSLLDYPELPPDECWDIPRMPERTCNQSWKAFHTLMQQGETETEHVLREVYFTLAAQIPDHKKGIPQPPSQERCGPNHDGTWVEKELVDSPTKPGLKEEIERYYTILEDDDFRDCTLDFAQFAFKCQGDPMYIHTDECEALARNWRGIPQMIADIGDE